MEHFGRYNYIYKYKYIYIYIYFSLVTVQPLTWEWELSLNHISKRNHNKELLTIEQKLAKNVIHCLILVGKCAACFRSQNLIVLFQIQVQYLLQRRKKSIIYQLFVEELYF